MVVYNLETGSASTMTVPITQQNPNWQNTDDAASIDVGGVSVAAKTTGSYSLSITTSGDFTIN